MIAAFGARQSSVLIRRMSLVIENARVLTGDSIAENASVLVERGFVRLVSTGCAGDHPADHRIDLDNRRLVPGFVDIQVNGGGGVLFNNAPTVESIQRIADAHAQFGTTSLLPTLISDDFDTMRDAIGAVRTAIDDKLPGILGIHLEGPFLNVERKGAHDPGRIRAIDDESIEIVTSLGDDAVTLITLAPEQTTPERIAQLVEAGVIVFAGHTQASYDQCVAAEEAGLSGYTHLFNGMTPFGSREPGVVGAAIESEDAVFDIIADGHHVHPASVRLACRAKRKGGALLVTDAMPTVGSDATAFELYEENIKLADGVLRNAAGSLAGSNLSMIEAVSNAMRFIGVSWDEAVRMASTYPAQAIGRQGFIGCIEPGARADLVELPDDLKIARVWRSGELVYMAKRRGDKIA